MITRASDPVRLAVFDCDGTLVDSQFLIVAAMTAAFRAHGHEPPAAEAVRRLVGISLQETIAELVPDAPIQDRDAIRQGYADSFATLRQGGGYDERLYPGVVEALDCLDAANYLIGLATGKSRRGVDWTLGRYGILARFATIQTADHGPSKPNPDMLLRAMAETGAGPAGTVFIGDTTFDMEMAANAGVMGIGVDWGYHEPEELLRAGARVVLQRFGDLGPILTDLNDPEADL